MITGHCECGRVRFEIDGAVEDLSHCHCSQCRRLHGAAYATFAGVPRDSFRYLEGNADVKTYPACPPAYHQFVGSKAAWHEITDQLPQHDEWPPE